MNSNSNALTLLRFEYESDSSDENETKLYENNCLTNIENNLNISEDELKKSVELSLNQLIEKVVNDLNPNEDSKHFSYYSNCFSTTRLVRSEAEIDISSSSSSSSWSLSSDNESIDEELMQTNESNVKKEGQKKINFVKTRGELSIEELPPIENLSIKVNVEELTQIGRVISIVDQLVIVQSFRSMPALDLDSVLFLKDGSPLGSVFDVFGPVIEPHYAIRFNTNQQIVDRNITAETPVYFAADYQKPITGYVFAEQLRRQKGSDASWKHNNEPPEEVKEFSDDETERQYKQRERAKGRRRNQHNYDNSYVNTNHNQRHVSNNPFNIRVPPNTPNSPYNQYYLNHYQQYPHQLSQPNNWFANTHQ